jgi:hypothetical protein
VIDTFCPLFVHILRPVCAPHLFQEVVDKEAGTTYLPQVPLVIMNSQSTQSPSNVPNAWGVACRPTLLFVAAYALSITPHEAVHALTSYLLGFSSTLFQMWVNPDPARATSRQLATIAAAGPFFSLAVGVTCWLFYQRQFRRKPAALMFLMLAMVGVYSFLGPLAGSALGGDFNLAFTFLDVPKAVRYAASAMGFVLLPCFMFFMGGNWWDGHPVTSVVPKLLAARPLRPGSSEPPSYCWFIGRCRPFDWVNPRWLCVLAVCSRGRDFQILNSRACRDNFFV